MFFSNQDHFILLLVFLLIVAQVCSIEGPSNIKGYVGENATFIWNTTDNKEIFTVSWGIKKGNIADPQYINVNGYSGKMNINADLDARIKTRVKFIGDLKKGHAWFVLKNLTVSDTNEYIASISDDARTVLAYPVHLVVQKKEEKKSYTTGSTVAPENMTTKPTQVVPPTTGSTNVTGATNSSTANRVRSIYCYLMFITIALLM